MYKSASTEDGKDFKEWEVAGWLSQLTFSVPNRMLNTGLERPLRFDDLTSPPPEDYIEPLLEALQVSFIGISLILSGCFSRWLEVD